MTKIVTHLPSQFQIQDRVQIDKSNITGSVIEVAFRHDGLISYIIYQVEWLHNGVNTAVYMPGWRLTKAE